jgi:ribosome assembly protein RRB1
LTSIEDSGFVTSKSYNSHTGSVEDIQWSPSQQGVFASCSSDKTIKIWDMRTHSSQLSVTAHQTDVNCISWNM